MTGIMNELSIEEQAKDFRARKAYEILFEKDNPTLLELEFLMFLMESVNNHKLINLIRNHKKWKQKKRKKSKK